jgi:hypothetical protein
MKNTISSVFATYGKQFLAAMLTFIMLQYSHGLMISDIGLEAILSAAAAALFGAALKALNIGNAFFDTWYGNVLKTIATVSISLFLEQLSTGSTLFTIDYPDFINTAFAAIIPTLINILNPNDVRYGLKKE